MRKKIEVLLSAEAAAINNIPVNDEYVKAIDLIYKAIHLNHGKLIASGMGKAGQIANNIATTFSSTGTPSVFLHPSDAQHGDIGVIQQNDILLLVSNSGKTREVLELYTLSRNLCPKIPVIVLTGNADSPLGQFADAVLTTGNPKEVCLLGLTPTTSMTAMMVIGDILVVLMMERIAFTPVEYAKRHHGGYLGHKSRNASGSQG